MLFRGYFGPNAVYLLQALVKITEYIVIDFEEVGDATGGGRKGAQNRETLLDRIGFFNIFEETADEYADQGNLTFQAFELMRLEIGDIHVAEAASIEAGFQGIGVAGLAAALAFLLGILFSGHGLVSGVKSYQSMSE